MDVTEDELLTAIRRVLSDAPPEVVVGVGDDAAVVRPGAGELVLTTDALVEGSHFVRGLTTPRDLGHRAIAVNVSDIAAMAASPRYALCALTLSDAVDAAWTMELFGGMREACDAFACTLVGGNLARGRDVTVAVTVCGEVASGRAITRAGARAGEVVVVTGELGSSSAGRRLRDRGPSWDELERAAIRLADRGQARVGEGALLARHGATAMLDISDGLCLDLARLCAVSAVGVRLRQTDLPVGPRATVDEALGGGEDHELLAAMPAADVGPAAAAMHETFGVPLTAIGDVTPAGLVLLDAAGQERPLPAAGWDHFA